MRLFPLTLMAWVIVGTAQADTASYDACVAAISATSLACTEASTQPSGSAVAFQSGQNAVCDLNYHALENVNQMLCFLEHELAFDGSATGSATVDSVAYTWVYASTGLEAFATTAGYTNRLTVAKAGVDQMTMWWDGSGATTKGFLISNKLGVTLSNELAIYIQWDKSAADQWVRYLRGTWSDSVNTGGPMDANGGSINRGKYGYLSYNTSTLKSAGLEIVDVKGNPSDTSLMCEKFRIWGDFDGSLAIWAATGLASTSSTVDVTGGSGNVFPTTTGVAGASLADFTTTVDSVVGPGDFSKNCNSIYTTMDGGAAELFGQNTDGLRLDLTKTPTQVFGTATP